MKLLQMFGLVCLASAAPVRAEVVEPKEIRNQSALKSGEGVLRLSMRSQRQFIETAYLYFVRLNPDGSDGTRILRFERGAGVPVMESNQIDVKAKYYSIPEGSYRLQAYTVACSSVPEPGSTCFFGSHALPTEAYVTASPTFEVAQGAVTDGGDFVIEYTKDVDLDKADLFDDRYSDEAYSCLILLPLNRA